jgi:hypothetical protein
MRTMENNPIFHRESKQNADVHQLTPKDFTILQLALSDAVDHQVHILDTLTTARAMSRFSDSIRERNELLNDYRRLGERLKEATIQSGRSCEHRGRPSSNRLCSNECYSAHYAGTEK